MPSSPGIVGLARAHPLTKTRAMEPSRQTCPVTAHPTRWGVVPLWLFFCMVCRIISGAARSRRYPSQARGLIFFSLVSPRYSYNFRGICLLYFPFFPVFSFSFIFLLWIFSLFNVSGLLTCVCCACRIQHEGMALWHGVALPTPATPFTASLLVRRSRTPVVAVVLYTSKYQVAVVYLCCVVGLRPQSLYLCRMSPHGHGVCWMTIKTRLHVMNTHADTIISSILTSKT